MKFGRKLRAILGHYQYLKAVKKVHRIPEIVSFDEAKNIGLLYDATDERNSDFVKNYVKLVRSNYKKEIIAMGFVDRKSLPASQFAQYGLDFFSRKDLNFKMIPSNPIVSNYINEKFDILINLNSERCFPLQYITAMSQAKFKVGRYTRNNTDCFDMMVELKGDPAIKTIIEEIEHFLRLIKRS